MKYEINIRMEKIPCILYLKKKKKKKKKKHIWHKTEDRR